MSTPCSLLSLYQRRGDTFQVCLCLADWETKMETGLFVVSHLLLGVKQGSAFLSGEGRQKTTVYLLLQVHHVNILAYATPLWLF